MRSSITWPCLSVCPRLGRQPSEIELAGALGISVEELDKMILDANAVNLISLNKKWYETDSYKDVREIDILEDKKGEDPTRRIQKNDLMRLVTKGLNRNERLIIILYYYEELTMKEIGGLLGINESRVSQIHKSALEKMATVLKIAELSYLEAEIKKVIADGAVREVTIAPGTNLQWMALRRGGTRADILRLARWDGPKPFAGFPAASGCPSSP